MEGGMGRGILLPWVEGDMGWLGRKSEEERIGMLEGARERRRGLGSARDGVS